MCLCVRVPVLSCGCALVGVPGYGTQVLIRADTVAQAGYAVELALLDHHPELACHYAGQLLVAQRDIERRLENAIRLEAVSMTDLSDDAQHRLGNCVANYALALLGARWRSAQLRAQARNSKVCSMLEWARRQRSADPAWSVLAFFEQWVIDGHPRHPAAKVRLGMTPADVLTTCPEWGNTVALPVVALRKDQAADMSAEFTRLLLREHPQLRAAGTAELDVTLLPVHPWQAKNVLPQRYRDELASGALRLLPATIPARPLISYRSFIPLATSSTSHPHHLKTALSVQLTNAVRGVSPAAAANGPAVSALLAQILHREGDFGGRLRILPETAATHFKSTNSEPPAAPLELGRSSALELGRSSALAALARHNPETELEHDELLLPVSALWARSPISGKPILAEILDELRASTVPGTPRLSSVAEAAEYFTRRYADVFLPPLLTLLTRYGVALEAHGENTLLAITGGLPGRCFIRDFGGIRIHLTRLARRQLSVSLVPGSDLATDDGEQLRNKLYFALFVNDLGELVGCLSRLSGRPAGTFWRHFHSVASATFETLIADPDQCQAARDDATALLERPWPNKAVLSMWLHGKVTDYDYVPIDNPLSTCMRQ